MDGEPQSLISEKKNIYLELALFLILGFLLGIVIKTEASKRITIGFNDYQIGAYGPAYDINQLQKDINKQQAEEKAKAESNQGNANGDQATQGAETVR